MNENIFFYTVDILTSYLSRLISFNFCITDRRESWLVKQGMESQESPPKHITHICIPQTFFFFKFQGLILFKLHSNTQPSISAWRRKFPVLFHLLSAYIESNQFCPVPRSVHHINCQWNKLIPLSQRSSIWTVKHLRIIGCRRCPRGTLRNVDGWWNHSEVDVNSYPTSTHKKSV